MPALHIDKSAFSYKGQLQAVRSNTVPSHLKDELKLAAMQEKEIFYPNTLKERTEYRTTRGKVRTALYQ